jgi:hypothetical protein
VIVVRWEASENNGWFGLVFLVVVNHGDCAVGWGVEKACEKGAGLVVSEAVLVGPVGIVLC